jgi:sulfonate transport system permease protein
VSNLRIYIKEAHPFYNKNVLRSYPHIYRSRVHIGLTIVIVILPFFAFLFLSQIADVTFTRLMGDVSISFIRLAIAYGIAVLLAWAGAMLFYRRAHSLILLPLFDVLQSFPIFAVLPFAVYWWGPSNAIIISFLVLTILWPIFFSLVTSMKLIRRDWEEAVRMTRISGWQYMRHFLIPASRPALITGSMIGLGEAWEAIVATEIIVGTEYGIGHFFKTHAADPALTLLGILGVLMLIFSVNKLIWLPLLDRSRELMEE